MHRGQRFDVKRRQCDDILAVCSRRPHTQHSPIAAAHCGLELDHLLGKHARDCQSSWAVGVLAPAPGGSRRSRGGTLPRHNSCRGEADPALQQLMSGAANVEHITQLTPSPRPAGTPRSVHGACRRAMHRAQAPSAAQARHQLRQAGIRGGGGGRRRGSRGAWCCSRTAAGSGSAVSVCASDVWVWVRVGGGAMLACRGCPPAAAAPPDCERAQPSLHRR